MPRTDLVYKETCADYYFRYHTHEQFDKQLSFLISDKGYVAVDDHQGFYLTNFVGKVIQMVKGFLGFTNNTKAVRVNSEAIKLLYYGEVKGYFQSKVTLELLEEFLNTTAKDEAIKEFARTIFKAHSEGNQVDREALRKKNLTFHQKNETQLQPSFFTKISLQPVLKSPTINDFGNSHLQMAELILKNVKMREFCGEKYIADEAMLKSLCRHLMSAWTMRSESIHYLNKYLVLIGKIISQGSQMDEDDKLACRRIYCELVEACFENHSYDSVQVVAEFGMFHTSRDVYPRLHSNLYLMHLLSKIRTGKQIEYTEMANSIDYLKIALETLEREDKSKYFQILREIGLALRDAGVKKSDPFLFRLAHHYLSLGFACYREDPVLNHQYLKSLMWKWSYISTKLEKDTFAKELEEAMSHCQGVSFEDFQGFASAFEVKLLQNGFEEMMLILQYARTRLGDEIFVLNLHGWAITKMLKEIINCPISKNIANAPIILELAFRFMSNIVKMSEAEPKTRVDLLDVTFNTTILLGQSAENNKHFDLARTYYQKCLGCLNLISDENKKKQLQAKIAAIPT